MSNYFLDKMDAATFVRNTIQRSKPDSALTITIKREKYEGYFVVTVTEGLSGDTQTGTSSSEQGNT